MQLCITDVNYLNKILFKPNLCFEQKYENKLSFLSREKSLYIALACFRNGSKFHIKLMVVCANINMLELSHFCRSSDIN